MEFIVIAGIVGIVMSAGAYLEHKFGAKLAARVAALEAKAVAAEGKVEAAKKAL